MEAEPNSIIHQVMRLEKKLVRVLKKKSTRSRTARRSRRKVSGDEDSICTSRSATSSFGLKLTSHSLDDMKSVASSDLYSVASFDGDEEDLCSTVFDSSGSHEDGNGDQIVKFLDSEHYSTVGQHEFLENYLEDDRADTCFVHFYVDGSEVSKQIDHQMNEISTSLQSASKFIRVDALNSLHATTKLDVKNNQPTVVALKGGKAINKLSQFTNEDCSELQQWVSTIELINMFSARRS